MHYAGVGSRRTPDDVLREMYDLACILSIRGWVLRSGGADGADEAFERGANEKEIYLPWPRFNGNPSRLCRVSAEAIEESLKFHPTPDILNDASRKFMGRNLYQVLGQDLRTPCRFVVCWTPFSTEAAFDPKKWIGGTGQAIRIAGHRNIPIYNLRERLAIPTLMKDLECLESSAPKPNPIP